MVVKSHSLSSLSAKLIMSTFRICLLDKHSRSATHVPRPVLGARDKRGGNRQSQSRVMAESMGFEIKQSGSPTAS